ncbi:IS91 family transposase [Inhella sp.]|uniref:IS91 family transposase n=1 Tax=Inhella sp. TaxID=1921806 RepID=UPI0035B28DE3
MLTLAQLLRLGAEPYLRTHPLSTPQARAWRGICACRTALLGGQCLACAQCGHRHWQYHSCRNRHCPQCGARERDAWLRGRLAEVLEVPYAHLVFTLPHELNSLYRCQPRWVIETLFASVAATLKDFAANPRWMGIEDGQAAFSLVLHTWSQDLRQHLHLHALMACGVLGHDGQWHTPARQPDFLFPVQALSKVYRGKFMAALRQLARHSELQDVNLTASGRKALVKHDWVVYAKTPLGGAAQVLEYLGRYTHRTAIGNERLQALTREREVVFTARADPEGGKRRVRLPIEEFIRRFLLHVLPGGVQRIRHYGVLANGCKKTQLAQARASLAQPAVHKATLESAQAFMARVARIELSRCPQCRHGHLQVVQTLPGLKHLPGPQGSRSAEPARERGPP